MTEVRGNELTEAQLVTVIANGWTRKEIETYKFTPREDGVSVRMEENEPVKVYISRQVMQAGKAKQEAKRLEKVEAETAAMGREVVDPDPYA